MLLLNTDRKLYTGSPIPPLHFTLSDFVRSKLMCLKWSNIDTCIVTYRVRVNPKLQLIKFAALSMQKSAENCQCHPNCSCQAGRQGPLSSCLVFASGNPPRKDQPAENKKITERNSEVAVALLCCWAWYTIWYSGDRWRNLKLSVPKAQGSPAVISLLGLGMRVFKLPIIYRYDHRQSVQSRRCVG